MDSPERRIENDPVELRELRRDLSALPPSEEADDYESSPDPNSTRKLQDVGVPQTEYGVLTRALAHLNRPRRERTRDFERL
jgi:hypothetical protein